MYDSLVAIDKDLKIIPWLAESWDTPDPTTYIFHLRKDVKFHDGTDFNADAVKFNLDRYQNDEKSARKGEINFIKTTEAVDPYTVKVTMKAPFAPFLASLVDRAGMMLSPAAVNCYGVYSSTHRHTDREQADMRKCSDGRVGRPQGGVLGGIDDQVAIVLDNQIGAAVAVRVRRPDRRTLR
jgi:MarR-like DNA-binding transcriptional regulator SgrR of sgrS sRNA